MLIIEQNNRHIILPSHKETMTQKVASKLVYINLKQFW